MGKISEAKRTQKSRFCKICQGSGNRKQLKAIKHEPGNKAMQKHWPLCGQTKCIGHCVANQNALATLWPTKQTTHIVANETNNPHSGQRNKQLTLWPMKQITRIVANETNNSLCGQ